MKFSGKDRIRVVAYTVALSGIVIVLAALDHTSLYIQAILVGFSAAIASLTVHVEILRKDLRKLSGGTPEQLPNKGQKHKAEPDR